MSPARKDHLNRRLGYRIVGQETHEPPRLEIPRNAQQRQHANALPSQRGRPDGLDAIAAQISSGLDLMLLRPAGEAPAIGAAAIVDAEAIVRSELLGSPRRATARQIDRRCADDPLRLAESPLD